MSDIPFTPWRMPPARPNLLTAGAKVAVVTPSWGGPACFPRRFEAGLRCLEDAFGLDPVVIPHAEKPAEWLDKHPEARAADLMQAFADKEIAAIIVSIGGDDAIRLMPHLDLGVISLNPKVFLGYSDATVLHFACLKAGVLSFYGPTVMAGFADTGGIYEFTAQAIRRLLFSIEPPGLLPRNTQGWSDERLDWSASDTWNHRRRMKTCVAPKLWQGAGKSRGHLIGGCAEVLEMLKGTDLWPPLRYWDGAFLFYETSEEAPPPCVVRRWMRNFGAQGILGRIAGLVVGRPGGGIPVERQDDYCAVIAGVLAEYGADDVPLISGLDFGHTDPMMVLPCGAIAGIDCSEVSLSVPEPSVTETSASESESA